MKKYLILLLFIPFISKAQTLDTVNVNLTLRASDWAFLVGRIQSTDSATLVQVRRLRDTIRLANPATFNTTVRYNSIPAKVVFKMYVVLKTLHVSLYEQVGVNASNQIKAIPNTTLQNFITAFDNEAAAQYLEIRTMGKNILIDN